uniref:Uncharacterized protein n=1 Tax=Anas platyrhynchos platyrhynchos TaxID=8840 RepID=A0A493SUG6_ANAPP
MGGWGSSSLGWLERGRGEGWCWGRAAGPAGALCDGAEQFYSWHCGSVSRAPSRSVRLREFLAVIFSLDLKFTLPSGTLFSPRPRETSVQRSLEFNPK